MDMQLNKYTKRNLFFIAAGIIFFFIIFYTFKGHPLIFGEHNFSAIHSVLELASIIISYLIAFQSWIVFNYKQSKDRLLYAAGFFTTGTLDFLHTLTYNGMSGFIFLESSAAIAMWFWILARLTQASFIFYIVVFMKNKSVPQKNKKIYAINTIVYITFLLIFIILFENSLPLLTTGGTSSTPLKFAIEMIIISLLMITLIKLYFKYRENKNRITIDLINAIVFLLLSEFIFTRYFHIYEAMYILGHMYKISGFAFLLRALYLETIKEPIDNWTKTRKELIRSKNRLKTITSSLGEGVFVVDKNKKLTFINREGERLLGFRRNEILDFEIHELIHKKKPSGENLPASECPVCLSIEKKEQIRVDDDLFFRKDGSKFSVSYVSTPLIEENEVTGAVVVFQDITKQKEYVNKIEYLAFHNQLTNLPNRHYLIKKLQEKIEETGIPDNFAFIVIDIDDFKNINDTYGHMIGDEILKTVGNRLVSMCDGFVAHISGDEFGIIIDGNKPRVEKKVKEILESFHESIPVKGNEIFTTISIGISMFPFDGINVEKLIQVADIALFEAKKAGKNNYLFYNDDLEYKRIRKSWIEQNLYWALVNQEITVHYQPIVDTETKKIIGLEALARWYHPEEGYISPVEFISVAEKNGLIIPIGTYIINLACRDTALLKKKGHKDLYVSINLSLKQLKHPEFLNAVDKIVKHHQLNPSDIEFEITESMTLQDDPVLIQTISTLKEKNFRIAIDDFGKGFSSIGYLKQISVDTLKIDRSYIFNVYTDKKIARLTNAIITMGQNLQVKIVAEGVETKEHLNFLKKYPNIFAQGYYFSRPLPLNEFIDNFLDKNKSK